MMEKVFLKRSSRIRAGHLWIFSNELRTSPKQFEPGCVVEVYDSSDAFLGIGYINPHSLIAIRLLTRFNEPVNGAFFRKRIEAARHYRESFLADSHAYRVVHSEADFLPGLIVDKFGDCVVMQILTLGMERMRNLLIEILNGTLAPRVIVLRNDSRIRTLEGLPLEKELVQGSLDPLPIVREGDVAFEVDPMKGQKTGFFLDQRENRFALCSYVDGGKGLDLFCYTGAWGLHLAGKGAVVTGVDESEAALSRAMGNAALNSLTDRVSFVKADVFSFLRREVDSGKSYDFVVLDPPAFVRSRSKIKEGLRNYRGINAMAMKIVREGGIIATSSCSYHVDKLTFLDVLRDAAKDAGKTPRLLEYRSQGRDHPVLLTVPETEYLKCAIMRF